MMIMSLLHIFSCLPTLAGDRSLVRHPLKGGRLAGGSPIWEKVVKTHRLRTGRKEVRLTQDTTLRQRLSYCPQTKSIAL